MVSRTLFESRALAKHLDISCLIQLISLMTEPQILAIPEATKKRDGRYHDAARLYIHQRKTNLAELSKLTGLAANFLRKIRHEDDWDGFVDKLASRSLTSVFSCTALVDRAEGQMKLMKQEVEDQAAMVEKLRTERGKVLEVIATGSPGTKAYSAALSSLALIRKELEGITGLDDMKSEVSALRLERMKKQPAAQQSAGIIIDLGRERP